ncbi:MAG: OmpA family protein [Rhizomicrobium sp.]
MTKTVVRLAAVMAFALCTGACSTLDDMLSDDTPAPAGTPAADSTGFPPDTAPPGATADASAPAPSAAPSNDGNPLAAGTQADTSAAAPPADTAPAATADNTAAPAPAAPPPDLAAVPEKPSGTTTPDEQREAADSLAADRARTNYSGEALRGGTEPAAAPPGPPAADTAVATATPPSTPTPDNAPAPAASTPAASAPAPDSAAPASDAAPAPTTRVASAPVAAPPGSQPAVPANAGVPGAQPGVMSDAQLGFRPSAAPALDPSISQFVAQPIIARYQQTASNAGIATGTIRPLSADQAMAAAVPLKRRGRATAVGGPEAMTGSVVANLDVLNGTGSSTPSVYANPAGMPPAAVVMFPGDGTALNAAGRAQIRAAVETFQQRGGSGFIKVIGHSSSRTSNMPVEKHLEAIFAKSQQRANAVAREIIREGVPASRVLVEAVGDSQPVYYESMPQGEDGNRRAEIFIQG